MLLQLSLLYHKLSNLHIHLARFAVLQAIQELANPVQLRMLQLSLLYMYQTGGILCSLACRTRSWRNPACRTTSWRNPVQLGLPYHKLEESCAARLAVPEAGGSCAARLAVPEAGGSCAARLAVPQAGGILCSWTWPVVPQAGGILCSSA